MRNISKTRAIALTLACAISIPNAAYADTLKKGDGIVKIHGEGYEEAIKEAQRFGVPDAFIRHYFEKDYEYEDYSKGRIDLGEFDFGEYKAGSMIYNMDFSEKLKGKVNIYVGDGKEPAITYDIPKEDSTKEGELKNLAVDVRNAKLTGKKHLYLKVDSNDETVNDSVFLGSIFFTEASTPVISFDVDSIEKVNESELHEEKSDGSMEVLVPDGYKPSANTTEEKIEDKKYELEYIRGRGNSTWKASKKPYKLKLEKAASILGLPLSKHWALLANYYDYTLIRNRYTFYLAEKLGLKYTPKSVPVEVIMNGEYYGSYELAENVRIGKNRVDIDNLEKEQASEGEAVTGGYLLQHESSWLTDEDLPKIGYDFTNKLEEANVHTSLVIERPDYAGVDDSIKTAQVDYMDDYVRKIDKAVYGMDSNKDLNWRDYLDEDSLIKHTLIQSFSMNYDAYSGSTYYYKPRNDKLYCGPVWDFDYAAWGAAETNAEFPVLDRETFGEFGPGVVRFSVAWEAPWFMELYTKDEKFYENVKSTWKEFSAIIKDSLTDGGVYDQMAEETYLTALANYQVNKSYLVDEDRTYPEKYSKNIDDDGNPYTVNYGNEVDRLKSFIAHRVVWTDEYIGQMYDVEAYYMDLFRYLRF